MKKKIAILIVFCILSIVMIESQSLATFNSPVVPDPMPVMPTSTPHVTNDGDPISIPNPHSPSHGLDIDRSFLTTPVPDVEKMNVVKIEKPKKAKMIEIEVEIEEPSILPITGGN